MPHDPSNEKGNAPKSHIDMLLVNSGAEQDLLKKNPEKLYQSSYLNKFILFYLVLVLLVFKCIQFGWFV